MRIVIECDMIQYYTRIIIVNWNPQNNKNNFIVPRWGAIAYNIIIIIVYFMMCTKLVL
jgi:hypothetical protein